MRSPHRSPVQLSTASLFRIATVLAAAIIAMSIFYFVVGLPYASISEECPVGASCVAERGAFFVPTDWALVPLILGGYVAVVAFARRRTAAWAGIVPLLVFSFLSLPSIGSLYLPFVVAIAVLLLVSRDRGAPERSLDGSARS